MLSKNDHVNRFFQEHDAPTHCTREQLGAQMQPIAEVTAALQHQLLEFRLLLTNIERAPHDDGINGKLEMLHQTLEALDTDAREVFARMRRLDVSMAQWHRYVEQAKIDVPRYEALQGDGANGTPSRVPPAGAAAARALP